MMRETFIAPNEHAAPQDKRMRRGTEPSAGRAVISGMLAVLVDCAAVTFTAVLLWLGAGTTVLSGAPIVMTIAFAGGAVLASASNLLQVGVRTVGAVTVALVHTVVIVVATVLQFTVVPTYFFSWVVVFAGAFFAARSAVALVVDAFASRAVGALAWRVVAIGAGVTAVVLLRGVWSDSTLLADLVVFVVLLAIAAVLFELGIRSFRTTLKSDS